MFTVDFMAEQRYAFAEQIVQAMYSYTIEGEEQNVALAYYLYRTIEDTTIRYTFRLPNTQGKPHSIDKIYLFKEEADLNSILKETDAAKRIAAVEQLEIGEFNVDTKVNAFQSYAVRLNVQYWETGDYNEDDGG